METMRVLGDEICYWAKEYLIVHKLFATRADLYRTVYMHAKVKAIEIMIVDALVKANSYLEISSYILAEGKSCLVSWDEVTKPYAGGLDAKKLSAWNRSAFFLLIGDIVLQLPSIWSRWVLANHTRGGSIWTIEKKVYNSWTWKGLLGVWDELRAVINYPVGNCLQAITNSNGRLACRRVYDELWLRSPLVDWGDIIWSGMQCKKWSFVAWVAARNRLQTGRRVEHWKGEEAAWCPLCKKVEETEVHLWFECEN